MSDVLTIEGKEVRVRTPEGKCATLPVADFVARIAPRRMDTAGVILPDGVKGAFSEGRTTIWVVETPPRSHALRWLAGDSPARFGRGAKYRVVRLGLPYVVVLAVFAAGPDGQLYLTQHNECYFRCDPLTRVEDELFYPALLNCSKMEAPDGRVLSWLCTQHVDFNTLAQERDLHRRLRSSLEALRRCLFETGFNYSSEHHEGASWFTESSGVDPRISTVENWQEASAQDPLFVLDVPWLPTGKTLGQTVEALFGTVGGPRQTCDSASALARTVLQQEQKRRMSLPWIHLAATPV